MESLLLYSEQEEAITHSERVGEGKATDMSANELCLRIIGETTESLMLTGRCTPIAIGWFPLWSLDRAASESSVPSKANCETVTIQRRDVCDLCERKSLRNRVWETGRCDPAHPQLKNRLHTRKAFRRETRTRKRKENKNEGEQLKTSLTTLKCR